MLRDVSTAKPSAAANARARAGAAARSRELVTGAYTQSMHPEDAHDIARALERDASILEFKLKQDMDQRNSFLGIYLVENPLRRTIRGYEVELHVHWGDVGVVNSANLRWPGEARGVGVRLGRSTIHACELALGHMHESNI